ncbi:putative transmembrane protein [Cinnamomum micranthum f. kanehirae]|uniref:Putative transmembrane protein n=1 Tax=Cinnamomum micranthum f. kanehirae TaxID=337451 RepID=A0A443NDQ6_9MAGN|nr:putative transmembrane protein [Cinnamomum micranthum f. kanehirae]
MASDSERPSSSPLMGTRRQTQTVGDNIFQGLANLIKLLPTGTLFIFQFLSPLVTNYGKCHTSNKYLTGILLFFCNFNCLFSCFTDSYKGTDGRNHYGVVTKDGLWSLSGSSDKSINLSQYKLRLGDFAHAFLSLMVFAVVALLTPNIVGCYYSSFESTQKTLLVVLPPVVGAISSTVFAVFPHMRHGIGYPPPQAAAA